MTDFYFFAKEEGIAFWDFFWKILGYPFTWGFLVGLLIAFWLWRSVRREVVFLRREQKRLEKDNADLQSHLNTQLKINAAGNKTLEEKLEELREQNETLRQNLNVVRQKPTKAELRHLQIVERAVGVMREQAPGFASAWEKAMRDAQSYEEDVDKGLKKLINRFIPTRSTASDTDKVKLIEAQEVNDEDVSR